jgi:hypothetical protein
MVGPFNVPSRLGAAVVCFRKGACLVTLRPKRVRRRLICGCFHDDGRNIVATAARLGEIDEVGRHPIIVADAQQPNDILFIIEAPAEAIRAQEETVAGR